MKHLAVGWACNLNEVFVRFPYEKCTSLIKKFKTFYERRKIVKQVFRESVYLIMDDIIENNVTFKLPPLGYLEGVIHMEAIVGSDFEKARKYGKFKKIDFLESLFTGYQMYLYIHGKRNSFLRPRKFPIYLGSYFKNKLIKYTNEGRSYC